MSELVEEQQQQEYDYCGFMCSYELERLQEIADNLKGLKKVNPEFAVEFRDKLIDILKGV